MRDASGRFLPGVSGCPGGVTKEKREFLQRLTEDDADDVYGAFMGLVRGGNAPAVIRAVEYIIGKPKSAPEDRAALEKALGPLAGLTTDAVLRLVAGAGPQP